MQPLNIRKRIRPRGRHHTAETKTGTPKEKHCCTHFILKKNADNPPEPSAHKRSFLYSFLSRPNCRSTSGKDRLPSEKARLSMTTLVCSNTDIWIMFWIDERRMIISTPFHFEERAAALAAVLSADERAAEGLAAAAAVAGETRLAPTRLFWARVFMVSNG